MNEAATIALEEEQSDTIKTAHFEQALTNTDPSVKAKVCFALLCFYFIFISFLFQFLFLYLSN